LLVIIAIGAGLVFWKSKVAGHSISYNSISKEEMELLLSDVAKTNPIALKRLAEDPEMKKQQLDSFKQLLAFASEAQRTGIANEKTNRSELENIRKEVVAVNYDREMNKDKGPMPPFAFIGEDQVKAFWGEGEQPPAGWWDSFKNRIGLGRKDHELEFEKFLETKLALLAESNPKMKDRQVTDDERQQAREFFAKIEIYSNEYETKLAKGEIAAELQKRIDLQTKLQQAQFLARLFAGKMSEQLKVSDEEVAKYIAEHPELGIAEKRAKAEEILNRAKAGEDFAALANEFSEDPGNKGPDGKLQGGFYGNNTKGKMVPQFEEAALALEPGQITQNLVETDYGFHIIKLERKGVSEEEASKGAETYDVRHILISTGVKDENSPFGGERPVKVHVRQLLEKEREQKALEEIMARNNVTVAEDFVIPEVSDEQIQESLKQQPGFQGPEKDEDVPPPPAAKPSPTKKK